LSTRTDETSTTNSDIIYGYDELGRVQTVTVTKQNGVTLGTSLVITYHYTPVGNIWYITYPNGTETDYGYNSLNRLTSVTNKLTSSGNILGSYSYTFPRGEVVKSPRRFSEAGSSLTTWGLVSIR
jgi:YD repeat-containing protein